MTYDDMEITALLRRKLAAKVGKDRYEVWFGPTTLLSVQNEKLTVGVPNSFSQKWLCSRFRHDLEASCEEAFGRRMAVEFCVDPTLAAQPPEPPCVTVPALAAAPAACNSNASRPARRRYESLASFVVGPSNRLAHTAAQMATEQPGKISPLFVYGQTGVGKTHLLEGICSAFKKAHGQASAIYLSAEQFTSYFLEALHGSGLPSFRRKYRDVELLLIDDVQFFAGKRATLVELLYTIDTLMRQGRQIVLAADRSLGALKGLGPELSTRLSGGMTCYVEPPEYQTRLGIVRQMAGQLGASMPDDVQVFIASHLTAQARELAGAIKRLQATSVAHTRAITLGMAEEALAELIHHSGHVVRLADIERAVCDEFGLDADSLRSDRKGKAFAHPRMLAMWLARKHTRSALSEIGQFFGKRTHSTVISAQRKVERWMAQGEPVQLANRRCKLEDVIRRVEAKIHAG